jgi:hypothetical protein
MERFLNLRYYFVPLPDPNFQFTKLTLLLGLLLILVGVAFGIYRKKYIKDSIAKKMLKAYPGKLKIYGFLILLLLVFREQGIPYLSMRIWWFVLLAFFLYSFLKLAFNYKKDYSKRRARMKKNASKQKYLPKRKR